MRHLLTSIRNISFRRSTSGDSTSNGDEDSTFSLKPAINDPQDRRISQGQAFLNSMADVKVLVYHYRAGNSPVVKNALDVITHWELTKILETNPTLQVSKKPIPALSRSIDIYQHDLHTASQDVAEPAGTHPNDGSNVAGVTFPIKIAMSILLGHHKELYIVSPKTS